MTIDRNRYTEQMPRAEVSRKRIYINLTVVFKWGFRKLRSLFEGLR